jgi:hypothetical protein
MRDITPNNIKQFLQGNIRWFGDYFNVLPRHLKEQVLWRASICKDDCVPYGKCKYCGCELPGKFYADKSCNEGVRFPDLMEKEDWEKYKKENNTKL